MRQISLQKVPNQSFSFTQDGNRWSVTIKQAVTSMIATIIINDVVVISGVRIMGDDFIIPYTYIGVLHGNLMLTTQQDLLPNWELFGQTQQLFYWTPDEMKALANG